MAESDSRNSFKLLVKAAESHGFLTRRAIARERDQDIDLVVWTPDSPEKAFAIALKKTLLKKSSKRKNLWGWVELTDRKGASGWLYTKCTYIVYERKDDFVLLQKKDLKEWIEAKNLPRWDLPFATSSWAASYRLYRRPNTKEAIFQIKISDALKNCRHHFWGKNERGS